MGILTSERFKKELKSLAIISVGTILFAIGINWFINPSGLYVGGVTGISQLVSRILYSTLGIKINLGLLIWSINVPLLLLAYKFIGKRFTYHTLYTVTFLTICLNVIPEKTFSEDVLLNIVVGGMIYALGSGTILKYGGSTGGLDILSQYLSMKKQGSFGQYSFYVNCIIITIAGFLQGWEIALYTILLMFVQMQMVDRIHTPHKSYTVFIVTTKQDEVIQTLQARLGRGITIINAEGAYTHTNRSLLMMVVSSYELYIALQLLNEVDPHSFTNVLQSSQVQGNFGRKIVDKAQ
ncbi:YitT family protein [Turicibacter sanguinis]|uniref:YitT family protein n=1 Tax=Turicibacter sanguinis TaxID=154288 RepID=UPI002941E3EF|nr:YitT family protein [Turicibacter sanguinis]